MFLIFDESDAMIRIFCRILSGLLSADILQHFQRAFPEILKEGH